MVNQLAVHDPALRAAAAYYGRQPEAAEVPHIEACPAAALRRPRRKGECRHPGL